MLGVVIQIDGYDPVAGAPVTLRAASRDEVALCHLNGQTWWPTIGRLPTLRYDLFDGAFGGQITAPSASLTVAVEPWPEFGRYALADARFRLWTGDVGADWSGYTLRFDGRVSEQPALKDGQAQIAFAVDDRWLDTALLPTYAGTTGAEGPAALKGQVKPLALGAPRYVAGTLVNATSSIFHLSHLGVQAVEAALERLARFGAPVGNYADYAALDSATIGRGTWATCRAGGFVRFGAPPEGQTSFLVQGDSSGPDGWARLPGRIIRRLALLSGGAGKIDDASLAALDAARPYPLSLYVDAQTTARQLIQQLAASVNAVAGVSWTGQLFVVPVGLSAPTITLAADGSALPPVGPVEQIGIAAPWKKLAIGAERAWTVHALSDIAFAAPLIDRGRYVPGETYREGNIVDLADGSRWIYEAGAPITSAPSAGPWKVLNPATKAADITYGDGVSLEDRKPAEKGATNSADPNSPFGPNGTIGGAVAYLERIEPLGEATELMKRAIVDQDAVIRQADRDRARLAAASLANLLDTNVQRMTLRDAGMVVDREAGRVYFHAVDQNAQAISKVEVGLNVVSGQITLLATRDEVAEMITVAQLSPEDAAEFGALVRRMNTVEISLDSIGAAVALKADSVTVTELGGMVRNVSQTLDALAGIVAAKVNSSDFTPLVDRIGMVEQVLQSIGDVSSYTVTVRQAELRANANAAAGLAALVGGSEAAQREIVRSAEVSQQLYARLVEGDAVEAARIGLLAAELSRAVARLGTVETVRASEDDALARSLTALSTELGSVSGSVTRLSETTSAADQARSRDIAQVSADVGKVGGRVSTLAEVVVGSDGAIARAVTTLDVNGRVSGTYNTNTGEAADFGVVADKFGVFLPNGDRIFYVDTDGAIAANFKSSAIGYDNLQLGAAQKAAFFVVEQDVAIGRGATTQIVSLTFVKEDADSLLKIMFNGDFASQDDLQFTGSFTIDGATVKSTSVNIVLDNPNSAGRMPITPFAYARGIAAGQHTVSFIVTNNETDNVALTIAAGSVIEVVELRKASIGSVTGSGATPIGTGGGGNGSGSGGTYSGGGRQPNVNIQ